MDQDLLNSLPSNPFLCSFQQYCLCLAPTYNLQGVCPFPPCPLSSFPSCLTLSVIVKCVESIERWFKSKLCTALCRYILLLEKPSHSVDSFLSKSIHCEVSSVLNCQFFLISCGNTLFSHITLVNPPGPADYWNKWTKWRRQGGKFSSKKYETYTGKAKCCLGKTPNANNTLCRATGVAASSLVIGQTISVPIFWCFLWRHEALPSKISEYSVGTSSKI